MVRLIAIKRVRYPRGRNGHENARGEAFEAAPEHAKVLVAAGLAQHAPVSPLRVADPTPRRGPGRPRKNPLPVVDTTDAPSDTSPPGEYSRRDMRAVDE